MPLFNSPRDIQLFNSINYELLSEVVEQNVHLYKLNIHATSDSLYGEDPTGKSYINCIQIPCLVTREDQEWDDSEFGVDVKQSATFAFLKDMLIDRAKTTVEIGDIIEYDNAYWEINSTIENQYIGGRRPDDANVTGGASVSIIASAHLTRRSKINIDDTQATTNERKL